MLVPIFKYHKMGNKFKSTHFNEIKRVNHTKRAAVFLERQGGVSRTPTLLRIVRYPEKRYSIEVIKNLLTLCEHFSNINSSSEFYKPIKL